ncbi:MAG: cytochrome c-type biogenesis CcmF C-terminal domain-containing protein [Ignavibacteriaceae bacterium]|nr:cytochrome c-type biogenesis CcmF C-terminal domain-containing protein [Ignavibacteriaceae bacterium]
MIGSIILTLALASSVVAACMYFMNFRGYNNALYYGRIAYHVMAMLVLVAAAMLEYLLLTHQYSFKYVYEYSSNELSTGILMASFWGGQEGSFMLWLVLTTIVGLVLQSYSSKRGDLEPRVMSVFGLATTFILLMVSPLFKNPFVYLWAEPIFIGIKNINPSLVNSPLIQSFLFSDGSSGQQFVKMNSELFSLLSTSGITLKDFVINGKGLNPQLTNFWMQIHPPILFTGFSMSTVPFCFAMAAMMKNDYKDWVKQSFPWLLAASGILGLGIMMGGYWAYEMLGWGGYWAWDPVENSSLIPWLVGVAGIHTLLVQKKSQSKGENVGKFAKTNIILCIMMYVLVIYSTFLTRSGVLGDASVHSFVDPGTMVYLFLVIFVGTFLGLGIGTLIYRWNYLTLHTKTDEDILSRELALFTAAIVLCASATIVLVGTSAPIFGHSVDAAFYNSMHIPIAIIIGLVNGLSLLLKWKTTKSNDLLKRSLFSAVASLILTVLIILFGGISDVLVMILTLTTTFALIVNLEIAIKIIRGNRKMLGAYVAHIGIAVFLLGVVSSSIYSRENDIDLIKNEPKTVLGYKMIFTGYRSIENQTKYAFNIKLSRNDKEYEVNPIMYISDFNNGLMREPAILSMATKDIYVSPLGYDDGSTNKAEGKQISLTIGGSADFSGAKITYNSFIAPDMSVMQSGGDFQMGAQLTVEKGGKSYNVDALMKKEGRDVKFVPVELKEANIRVQLQKVDPASQKADLIFAEINSTSTTQTPKEVLTISASTKPFINLVWTGILIMVVGFFISVSRRLKESFV